MSDAVVRRTDARQHSYSNHYRRMLAPLLAALEFGCHNTDYQPVMQALALLARVHRLDRLHRPA